MLSRRTFLRGALAAAPLASLWRRRAAAAGFGELVSDPAGLLDLPPGFSYKIIDRLGDAMTDGYLVPGAPDGMACFPGPEGTWILMRNHELGVGGPGGWSPVAVGMPAPAHAYDPEARGGVTRVVIDPTTLEAVTSNLVLFGTIRNCGGGISPWGWLTCEEDVSDGHGYVFLCPIDADTVQPPRRIDGYGRYMHEGSVIDPATMIAYLTEDRIDSCLYRFVPASPSTPFDGQLQALRVVGADGFDTGEGVEVGASWQVAWVDVDDATPAGDTCRDEAIGRGAAAFRRGEGIWWHGGAVYFTATGGGPIGAGQLFRLDPDGDGGTLTLIAQSEDLAFLDGIDGVTVAPWGDVFLCEDGEGAKHIRMIDAEGHVSDFARKQDDDGELAGACFSPDGRVLFVNLMKEGITVAITGPFPQVVPAGEPVPPIAPPPAPPTHPDGAGGMATEAGCGGDASSDVTVVVTAAAVVAIAR